uniref:Integrase zinc-binding domain-containing protein n=1 Tax=Strigamia maritima TaxID=126957 RepID=T1J162_STRMM
MLVFFNPTYEEELDDSGNGFKAVIPRALVKRALFTCHGHPLSGHAGRSKTLDRAKLLYYWPGMDRDTRIYVKACHHCQQYKPSQQKKCAGPYTPHNMTTPWEVMCIDLMGPKPASRIMDLVWKRTHILSDAESSITSGFAPKRDGPWEITKVHGGGAYQLRRISDGKIESSINIKDLSPYIPEYPLEQWTEDQMEGTDSPHETPGWMETPVSSNVSDDIPLVDEPMAVDTVPSQDTTKPLTKSQKQRRRKAKKQAAKEAEQLVPKPVDPPVVEPVRRSSRKRTRNTRLDDFVTFLQGYKFPELEPMDVSNNSD